MWNILLTLMIAAALILIWIMLYDSNRFVVVRHTFADKRIKRTFRAVMLSDLHGKQYGKNNELLLEAVRKAKPDAVFIAGDMMTARPHRKMDAAIHVLRELAAEYPIYYANGNHEHRLKLYPETYGDMAQEYEKALQEMGIRRLINEHAVLEEVGLAVYGSEIEREYYRRFRTYPMERDYLDKLLGKPDKSCYTVLLAHNPDYFPQYAEWGANLVLSGHVHGGMVRIPIVGKGMVSPAVRFFPKYDGGIYREGDSTMLLGRGLGMHTIPIRLFNPGEVLVLDFEPES